MLKRLFEQNEKTGSSSAHAQFLVFKLGCNEYGVDIENVRELRGYDTATPVANSREYIKGVINLRGAIVPIVDMRIKLNMGSATYDQSTAVIVLGIADRLIGAIVDSISNLVSIAPEQIDSAGHTGPASSLIGVSSLANRLLHLIDAEALYSSIDLGLIERLVTPITTPIVAAIDMQQRTAREHMLGTRYLWSTRASRNSQVSALKFRPHWRPVPK